MSEILPHSANSQANYGTVVSSIESAIPGDLIVVQASGNGHVGIYIGKENGKYKWINSSGGKGCPNRNDLPCKVLINDVPVNKTLNIRRFNIGG